MRIAVSGMQSAIIVLVVVLLVGLLAFINGFGGTQSVAGEAGSSPTPCISGSFVTSVNETGGGSITITCKVAAAGSDPDSSPAACGAGNWLTRVTETSGTLTLTCTAPLQEATSNCPGGSGGAPHQYAMNETNAGALVCALLSWASLTAFPTGCSAGNFVTAVGLTLTCAAPAQEAASAPAACNAGNYVSAVAESSAGVISYTCTADNPAEAASTPAACNANFFVSAVAESAAGVISYTCTQVSFGGLSNYPANCAAGEYAYGVGAALTCQDVRTVSFVSNANSCTDTTSGGAGKMAGFGVTFTTSGANMEHDVVITLDWKLTAPTTVTVNTQWILKYGSTTTPTCGAATTGTSVGNTYEFLNPVTATTAAQVKQSETVGIAGLAASTTYWVDVSVIDSSVASWTYSLPQLTVTET